MEYLSQKTDDQLVMSYIVGCNEAFDELLRRYQDRLYEYIAYQLGERYEHVEDIFQDTFVRVITSLRQGRYTESGHFYSWITRIAHNLIMDLFRSEAQCPCVECDASNDMDALADLGGSHSAHENVLVNEQTMTDVKRLMDRLPEQQRVVVYMRYYQNLSFKEIASITGVSINTSLGRMHYALQNMRRMADASGLSLDLV